LITSLKIAETKNEEAVMSICVTTGCLQFPGTKDENIVYKVVYKKYENFSFETPIYMSAGEKSDTVDRVAQNEMEGHFKNNEYPTLKGKTVIWEKQGVEIPNDVLLQIETEKDRVMFDDLEKEKQQYRKDRNWSDLKSASDNMIERISKRLEETQDLNHYLYLTEQYVNISFYERGQFDDSITKIIKAFIRLEKKDDLQSKLARLAKQLLISEGSLQKITSFVETLEEQNIFLPDDVKTLRDQAKKRYLLEGNKMYMLRTDRHKAEKILEQAHLSIENDFYIEVDPYEFGSKLFCYKEKNILENIILYKDFLEYDDQEREKLQNIKIYKRGKTEVVLSFNLSEQ